MIRIMNPSIAQWGISIVSDKRLKGEWNANNAVSITILSDLSDLGCRRLKKRA